VLSGSGALDDDGQHVADISSDNHEVRLSGDTAVVVARIHGTGSRDGKPIDNVWRVSAVFVRREGQWRVQSTHACVLKDRNEK
jgi:ketosteroid isomerase-like protein